MEQYITEHACSSEIQSLYPVARTLWKQQTMYADAVIAEVPRLGACLFLDNEIQSATDDEDIYHECLVHPVMHAQPPERRRRVLVVGGGEGATVREVLKWGDDVRNVDWVDIDGEVVAACREHLKWGQDAAYTDPRVSYFASDIRDFLQSSNDLYDVIIVDLPDPDPDADPADPTNLLNRAFWQQVMAHLAPGGAWVSHTGPVRRKGPSGADAIRRALPAETPVGTLTHYHMMIPSFQDDWGFVMSCRKSRDILPIPTRFLSHRAYEYIFQWAWDSGTA